MRGRMEWNNQSGRRSWTPGKCEVESGQDLFGELTDLTKGHFSIRIITIGCDGPNEDKNLGLLPAQHLIGSASKSI